jgi:hypothetical protein
LEFYQKAANGGHAKAHYRLGLIHEEGKCDVTADVGMAMKWFVAATLPHNFSVLFHYNYCVADLCRASVGIGGVSRYEKAAEKGSSLGQFRLGQMYERGIGTESSPIAGTSYSHYTGMECGDSQVHVCHVRRACL